MYAETELMLTYSPNLHQEVQQYDEFCCAQKITDSSEISVSGYNLWGGGDLFEAPEPVLEEPVPVTGLDPMTAALSMISCGEDAISPQSLTVLDIESSIKSGKILSEVFYECRKDLLAKEGNETPLSEVIRIELPNDKTDAQNASNDDNQNGASLQKSVSSHSLHSMDIVHQPAFTQCFVDFPVIDFGMRRAFSEGDIKTLDNTTLLHFPRVQPQIVTTTTTIVSEERKEKLSRYRIKKSKRNFGHKIKYACRKALADSQPRIRGRFAKSDA